jgi:tripartite-type tricarboxylate transporter receptor subunit TctC
MNRIIAISICLLFVILMSSGLTLAANYPTKPITVIVPYSVGGSMDFQARGISPYLTKELKTNIIIQNVIGANGVIGFNKGFKANPDGYTLVANNLPAVIITEISMPNSVFKTKEFIPLCAFARDDVILVTHPELFQTFDEFVKAAKTQPMRVGVTGKGTTVHLAGLIFEHALGVKFNMIPFGGGSESVTSLAGKHIDAVITIGSSAFTMLRAGKIKPLLLFAKERSPQYPNVPTPKELGYDIQPLANHTGILAPPKLPLRERQILEAAFERAVKNPSYKEWMEKGVAEYAPLIGKDYQNEIARVAKIVEGFQKFIK